MGRLIELSGVHYLQLGIIITVLLFFDGDKRHRVVGLIGDWFRNRKADLSRMAVRNNELNKCQILVE